jgi:tryptophan halogenase
LLKFQTGYRERQWIGNCVAVGLSAGFFEPLESTGIMLIEAAAVMIAEVFPLRDRAALDAGARNFNRLMTGRFERIVSFLKLHYCLTKRDEPYWRDNADPATWPEALVDLLAQWKHRPVSRFDFLVDLETFLPASYQYILYGMNAATDFAPAEGRYDEGAVAARASPRWPRRPARRSSTCRRIGSWSRPITRGDPFPAPCSRVPPPD